MKEEDLPESAKKQLKVWRVSGRKVRNLTSNVDDSINKFKRGNVSLRLLENRLETLAELKNEYRICSTIDVKCNTQKLTDMKVLDMFKLARSAGHFGIFCPCGIVRAASIFYLDESLSQV